MCQNVWREDRKREQRAKQASTPSKTRGAHLDTHRACCCKFVLPFLPWPQRLSWPAPQPPVTAAYQGLDLPNPPRQKRLQSCHTTQKKRTTTAKVPELSLNQPLMDVTGWACVFAFGLCAYVAGGGGHTGGRVNQLPIAHCEGACHSTHMQHPASASGIHSPRARKRTRAMHEGVHCE